MYVAHGDAEDDLCNEQAGQEPDGDVQQQSVGIVAVEEGGQRLDPSNIRTMVAGEHPQECPEAVSQQPGCEVGEDESQELGPQ